MNAIAILNELAVCQCGHNKFAFFTAICSHHTYGSCNEQRDWLTHRVFSRAHWPRVTQDRSRLALLGGVCRIVVLSFFNDSHSVYRSIRTCEYPPLSNETCDCIHKLLRNLSRPEIASVDKLSATRKKSAGTCNGAISNFTVLVASSPFPTGCKGSWCCMNIDHRDMTVWVTASMLSCVTGRRSGRL